MSEEGLTESVDPPGSYVAVTNIRVAIAGALVAAAFALLLSNLAGYLRQR